MQTQIIQWKKVPKYAKTIAYKRPFIIYEALLFFLIICVIAQ